MYLIYLLLFDDLALKAPSIILKSDKFSFFAENVYSKDICAVISASVGRQFTQNVKSDFFFLELKKSTVKLAAPAVLLLTGIGRSL